VYTYRGSWCAEGLRTTWESEWRVVGQQGSAYWYGDERMPAQVLSGNEGFFRPLEDVEISPDAPVDKRGGHAGCIREFVEAVRSGGTPETTASDNVKSLAMVFAAIESAQTGQSVPVRW
ncbi:MAG: gfo/Idh/MocA family oxidoreductase, partial [Anaerolineae bacterium]|nr:gfo/Idh/MocA family oxidoreductase [Anaerolineae bacterium]